MSQVNVEFGCGGNRLPGWLCHDIEVDITKPLPYDNDSVDNIRAEHVCEHVSGPEFLRFLDECWRILRPGGKVRICMPTIVKKRVFQQLPLGHVRDLILNHGHLAAYDGAIIETFLLASGFTDLCIGLDRDGNDHHYKVIGAFRDDLETCRCEAFKPKSLLFEKARDMGSGDALVYNSLKPSSRLPGPSPATAGDAPAGSDAGGTQTSPAC